MSNFSVNKTKKKSKISTKAHLTKLNLEIYCTLPKTGIDNVIVQTHGLFTSANGIYCFLKKY